MPEMQQLINRLAAETVRGIVATATGEIIVFTHGGVADLYRLYTNRRAALAGALVADRVIGRGAAWLLAGGGVAQVYARVISEPALAVLHDAGIAVSFGQKVPQIINRSGTGQCPVEKLTAWATTAEEACRLISDFFNK